MAACAGYSEPIHSIVEQVGDGSNLLGLNPEPSALILYVYEDTCYSFQCSVASYRSFS